eukprot:scaffold294_cov221-Amphora_coffeaeformis.AAC.3
MATIPTAVRCDEADIAGKIIVEISDDGVTDVDQSETLSPGDIFVFDNNVTVLGSDLQGAVFGRCVVLEDLLNNGNTLCALNFDLPDGRISLQGVFFNKMTIVASSGCYLGLEGSVDGFTNETGIYYPFEVADTENPPVDCPASFLAAWVEEAGDTFIDADQSELASSGDYVVFDGNVLQAGEFNGTTAGVCVLLPTQAADNTYCQITYEFEQGSVSVQGVFGTLVIVGGTGCFQGVQGSINAAQLTDGNFQYTPTFTETPPLACTENIFDMVWRETGGTELLSDYNEDGLASPGELFLFDATTLIVGNNMVNGTTSGKCQFLPSYDGSDEDVYCLFTFAFDEGILALQGQYTDMEIVGGSGCFINTSGRASVNFVADPETGDDIFEYSFEIY